MVAWPLRPLRSRAVHAGRCVPDGPGGGAPMRRHGGTTVERRLCEVWASVVNIRSWAV